MIDARVVDDGDIVSCGGVTSGLDLSLWLVEQYWDREISERVATYIEHQRSDSVWVRPSWRFFSKRTKNNAKAATLT